MMKAFLIPVGLSAGFILGLGVVGWYFTPPEYRPRAMRRQTRSGQVLPAMWEAPVYDLPERAPAWREWSEPVYR